MLRTLYAKLALGLLLLLIISGLVYSAISLTLVDNYMSRVSQEMNRHLARNIVADRNLVQEGRLDEKALKDTFMSYMTINPSIEIYLLDKSGKILSFSAEAGKVKRKSVSLDPIKTFLKMEEASLLLGDDPRSHDRQKAFSVTEIPGDGALDGYLYVVLRGEQYDTAADVTRNSYLVEMSVWAMVVSLGAGLLIGLIVFRILTRRLRRLTARMEDFASQSPDADTDISKPLPEGDEVETLSAAFDRMADRIGQQIEMLRDRDALRRRLVAQISHDLRTPLASMQGYLESLQIKKDSLTEDKRDEFLRITLRQGHRMERMLEELFELASLEAKESLPQLEPFSLSELIYDAVEKHRLKAESGQILLGLSVAQDTPFAFGDVGMTERVLDNLLDNAIQHTPESGRVDISASTAGDLVTVSITDNGPGIDGKEMKHVFEPFYRGENNIATTHHAGLGLAIAKSIMDMQNGTIGAANSATGTGSVFSFQLPLYRINVG